MQRAFRTNQAKCGDGGEAAALVAKFAAGTHTHCVDDNVGKGLGFGPGTSCHSCVPGRYCAGGSEPPSDCKAGTWDHDATATTACQTCPSGTWCSGGLQPPSTCPAGTWDHDLSAATKCKACPSNYVCPGGVVNNGPYIPRNCRPGTWDHDSNDDTVCEPCAAGYFCAGNNATKLACLRGFEDHDGSAATECKPCTAGYFCAGASSAGEKTACAAGQWDHDAKEAATLQCHYDVAQRGTSSHKAPARWLDPSCCVRVPASVSPSLCHEEPWCAHAAVWCGLSVVRVQRVCARVSVEPITQRSRLSCAPPSVLLSLHTSTASLRVVHAQITPTCATIQRRGAATQSSMGGRATSPLIITAKTSDSKLPRSIFVEATQSWVQLIKSSLP